MAQGGPPNNPGPPQNSYWNLQGNVVDEGEHFFGATNLAPLVFKTNDQERFRIDENGQIIFPDFANLGKGLLYSVNGNLTFQAFTGEKDRSLRADGTFAPVSWMCVGDDIYSLNEGNVGIGTTNPLGKLHVADGDVYFENQVYVGERITVMGRVRSDDTLRMEADYLQAASCSRAELGERVGIGRVPSDTYALDVNGDVRFTGEITAASIQFSEPFSVDQFTVNEQLKVGNTIYLNGAVPPDEQTEDAWDEITTTNGVLAFGQADANGYGEWGDDPQNHVKIGIGTNTPQKALHIRTFHTLQSTPDLGSHHGIRIEDYAPQAQNHQLSVFDLEARRASDLLPGHTYFSIGTPDKKDLFTFTDQGKLGIGTTKPQGAFHVKNDEAEDVLVIKNDGGVGIGTDNPNHKLVVSGTIGACKIIVEEENWCDYVFADDYQLISLYELEQYIASNKHLPNIPSAEEVAEEGLDLGDIQKLMMEKIEELTLYIIEQEKRIEKLENNSQE